MKNYVFYKCTFLTIDRAHDKKKTPPSFYKKPANVSTSPSHVTGNISPHPQHKGSLSLQEKTHQFDKMTRKYKDGSRESRDKGGFLLPEVPGVEGQSRITL